MRIVYQDLDDILSILNPSPRCLQSHSMLSVALKDVPEGVPFWIVEDSEIPEDRTFREAWEVPTEWGEPDGYGSQNYTFEGVEHA